MFDIAVFFARFLRIFLCICAWRIDITCVWHTL